MESLGLTAALAVTQLVKASSQSWMMLGDERCVLVIVGFEDVEGGESGAKDGGGE